MKFWLKSVFSFIKYHLPRKRFILTEEFKNCLGQLEHSSQNLFITGKAGTGKSTLIRYFRDHTKKSLVVVAPTGISALNIEGQTIHSFFHFPPQIITKKAVTNLSESRLYSQIDILIIDEISMVRVDVLEGIDLFLRRYGRNRNLPFGGIQVVLVGDLYQLPPVASREEEHILKKQYDSLFFFNAPAYKNGNFQIVELKEVFRQSDNQFISLLNKIRTGEADVATLAPINKRVSKEEGPNHIILTTTNGVADGINEAKLEAINKPLYTYSAQFEGDFPFQEKNLPAPIKLQLKQSAKVIFVKNDRGGRWINGSLGQIVALSEDKIKVRIIGNNKVVEVFPEQWENIEYENDEENEEIKVRIKGIMRQYPLKLAWAITIHKSQGMTFLFGKIDLTKSTFAHGQLYVALSRCRELKGLLLSKKIWPNDIKIDPEVVEFYNHNLNNSLISQS